MNEQEINRYMDIMDRKLQDSQINNIKLQNELAKTSAYSGNNDNGIARLQLDLDKLKDRIMHFLSGHILKRDEIGNEIWVEHPDDRNRVFTEYGVQQILKFIEAHVNIDTLMSCFTMEIINRQMNDFGNELADLIFEKYEYYFYHPSPEELYERFSKYFNSKGVPYTKELLYEKCLYWSNEELKEKYKNYPMTTMLILDMIYNTYLRALGGEERKSLRRQMNILDSGSQQVAQTQKASILKPSTW